MSKWFGKKTRISFSWRNPVAKITFNFSGWVRDAQVDKVTETKSGKEIDVTHIVQDELVKKLRAGTWSISLGDYLYSNSKETEIDISDVEAGDVV